MENQDEQHKSTRYADVNIGKSLKGKCHKHCHFTDVRAKGAEFEGWDFSYSVFTRAYFHETTFANCKFVGAQFIDCNFRNAKLRRTDFSYARFNGTTIPTDQIIQCLPSWPNVRRELLQMLRRNAASVGDYGSEKAFVVREIESQKEHLRKAWRHDDHYYQDKYGRRFKWLIAGLKLIALKIDSFAWGHGERLWKAPIALTIVLSIMSLFLAVYRFPGTSETSLSVFLDLTWSALLYHVDLFLAVPTRSEIRGLLLVDWLIAILRYVAIGMLVAALYRHLAHR